MLHIPSKAAKHHVAAAMTPDLVYSMLALCLLYSATPPRSREHGTQRGGVDRQQERTARRKPVNRDKHACVALSVTQKDTCSKDCALSCTWCEPSDLLVDTTQSATASGSALFPWSHDGTCACTVKHIFFGQWGGWVCQRKRFHMPHNATCRRTMSQ